jgi:hypothetical protein
MDDANQAMGFQDFFTSSEIDEQFLCRVDSLWELRVTNENVGVVLPDIWKFESSSLVNIELPVNKLERKANLERPTALFSPIECTEYRIDGLGDDL